MNDPQSWTDEMLKQHSLDPRQFADFRQSTLANGMRIIDAYNASGLHFTILPDRGMDIWTAHYKGIPLTWVAQGSPFPPDFGRTWLQQFNGGLLTTCELTHVGVAERDAMTGEFRDLHGNYSRLRAVDVAVDRSSQSLTLRGTVIEQRLFGEQLSLQRSYVLFQSEPVIHINDVVTNRGDQPMPLMLLYHINLGFPLVSEGAELVTPHQAVYPRDAEARPGFDHWATYDAPEVGYKEQVFFHHVMQDADGRSEVLLHNGDFGLTVNWDTTAMPYLTQWKNTRQGIYVSGIEPANCLPMGRDAERRSGRLVTLAPGEQVAMFTHIGVVEGADAVQQAQARIDALAANGTPSSAKLSDFAAPAE